MLVNPLLAIVDLFNLTEPLWHLPPALPPGLLHHPVRADDTDHCKYKIKEC